MAAYAAKRFSALSHTTVYVDAGAFEWISVRSTVTMLEQAGVRHTRGFSLNSTEYDTIARELGWGAQIIHGLAAAGITDKHMVIDTSANGAGFLNGQSGEPRRSPRVRQPHDHVCVSLGIPPTTDVASPKWHLGRQASATRRPLCRRLHLGRPAVARGPEQLARSPPGTRPRAQLAILRARGPGPEAY